MSDQALAPTIVSKLPLEFFSLRKKINHNLSKISWLKLEEERVLITHSRLALTLNSATSPPHSIFQLSLFSLQQDSHFKIKRSKESP